MSDLYQQFTGVLGAFEQRIRSALVRQTILESSTIRIASRGPGGTKLELKQPAGEGGVTATAFRRFTVRREGWLALEGEDADGNLVIVLKPDELRGYAGLSATPHDYAGHSLTAVRETDTGTWPVGDGYFMKVHNEDFPGDDLEYFHEVAWPPYIAAADSVADGCRTKTSSAPARQTFIAAQLVDMAEVLVDSVTLDAYDAGTPVGEPVQPVWLDANWSARRWTRWSWISNRLTLDTVSGSFVGGQ